MASSLPTTTETTAIIYSSQAPIELDANDESTMVVTPPGHSPSTHIPSHTTATATAAATATTTTTTAANTTINTSGNKNDTANESNTTVNTPATRTTTTILHGNPHYLTVTDPALLALDPAYRKYLKPKKSRPVYIQNILNYKKKVFWIFWTFIIATILGILFGTVWNPNKEEIYDDKKVRNLSLEVKWIQCRQSCSIVRDSCENTCSTSPVVNFQSCINACLPTSKYCNFECRIREPCFNQCHKTWEKCTVDCTTFIDQ